mmetsp:Transcript_23261/g.50858  ORF Transcript_23261/g.50858 Transcript_23261/m.50858 type:complete len:249 (-) Transcript_23261:293-1039(-)
MIVRIVASSITASSESEKTSLIGTITSATYLDESESAPRTRSASSSRKASSASKPLATAISRCTSTSARTSERVVSDRWSGISLSSTHARGSAIGDITTRATHTTPERAAAIFSLEGPVKMAEGMISPRNSTAVTEMMMAAHGGTSLSRKRGSASLATELSSSSVTSRWCLGWCCTSGSTRAAASLSLSSSLRSFTRRSVSSSETVPMVSPAAIAARNMQNKEHPRLIQSPIEENEAKDSSSAARLTM